MGPIGGKGRPSVGKVREWYVESRHLQGCSPCLCRLRTDGLAPASKYWTYRSHPSDIGPVSLVTCHRQKLDLRLLLYWLVWKRNWVQTRGSVSQRAGDSVGSPFSREQWDPSKSIDDSWKVVMHWPHEICIVNGHTRTKCGKHVAYWSDFPMQCVHQFKSPWLSDMSIACLRQSTRS
jgi:hypothetical protein